MSDKSKSSFTLAKLMMAVLFASLVMAATFVQSVVVFAICALGVFVLVAWFCIDVRMPPEATGALLGFTVPALMSLHILGEIVAPVPPGEYADRVDIVPMAVLTAVFGGGAGAWFGALVGMIAGIINGKLKR